MSKLCFPVVPENFTQELFVGERSIFLEVEVNGTDLGGGCRDDIFLTVKARREVQINSLRPEERRHFLAALEREREGILSNKAVRILSRGVGQDTSDSG